MTSADLIFALLRLNLAASAAIGLVLLLRRPARRWLGAHFAYRLWLLVPIAAAGVLLPGPSDGPARGLNDAAHLWLGACANALGLVWAVGFAAAVVLAARRHLRFAAAERAGRVGPAVVGVVQPRLVVPRDFAMRYPPQARRLIRGHELAHIERGDARLNALATLAAWVSWFNPLAHVALGDMRFDQELACDATVLADCRISRRAYAETLLSVAPAMLRAPLVSHLRGDRRSLETRLRAIMAPDAPQRRRDVALAGFASLSLATFAAAWLFQPPVIAPVTETPVFVGLAPPPAATVAWVYADLPKPRR